MSTIEIRINFAELGVTKFIIVFDLATGIVILMNESLSKWVTGRNIIKLILTIALILNAVTSSICLAELPDSTVHSGQDQVEIWHAGSRKTLVRFKHPTSAARKEWEQSAIASDIIDENLISVPDMAYLPGTSRLVYPLLDLMGLESAFGQGGYEPSWERTGWTSHGYDPLADKETTAFEVKPIPPIRKYENDNIIKYENSELKPRAVLLRVIKWRANRILNTPIAAECADPTLCFWHAVRDTSLPIIITEGAKKAASLLSADYAAISIPGTCWGLNFERGDKKHFGLSLLADLNPFMKKKRTYFISFDHDNVPLLTKQVDTSIYHLGKLLIAQGNEVRVIVLPGPEKGADDFIYARGPEAYHKLATEAATFQRWLAEKRPLMTLPEFFSNDWCVNTCDAHCETVAGKLLEK